MLRINNKLSIPDTEIELTAIRAQGSGGQNVNKVSSAIHLRFDIKASSLPEYCKLRLLSLKDKRINKDGVLILKAQKYRTQDKNRSDAIERLSELIIKATQIIKKRKPTKPSKSSIKRKHESKVKQSRQKELRRKVAD